MDIIKSCINCVKHKVYFHEENHDGCYCDHDDIHSSICPYEYIWHQNEWKCEFYVSEND